MHDLRPTQRAGAILRALLLCAHLGAELSNHTVLLGGRAFNLEGLPISPRSSASYFSSLLREEK
jgi:hypothetical protein